jgi:hypothetical protein
MKELEFSTTIKCGNSRRKVEDINLSLGDIKCRDEKNDWTYNVLCSGKISIEKELEGNSAFDCLTLGLAFLRQSLRSLVTENPKIKFFEEVDGDLEEITIEDIFWTHDCVTNEMEDMIEWAKENGYSPD